MSSTVLAQPALAQEIEYAQPAPPASGGSDAIVVVATGLPLSIDSTGQPVSVVDLDEIESIQGPDLTRVLSRLPGVTQSREGGPGSLTGVRVRGGEADDLLVLIDGVRVNDASDIGNQFDFGNLLAGNVERIELLRGSNSVVWGSDAISGVMNVVTRIDNGVAGSLEYGSDDTKYATLSAGTVQGPLAAGLAGSYYDTDGFSRAASGTEDDGFRQWQLTGRARYDLTPELAIVANGRFANGRTEFDGFPAPDYVLADTEDYSRTRQYSGRTGLHYATDLLTLDAGYALSDTRRRYYDAAQDEAFQYAYKGRSERAELFGRITPAGQVALDFGADREWTRFDTTFGDDAKANTTSGHALLGWYGEAASVAAGVRYDDHSRFGDEWSFGANGTVNLVSDVRLRASYGEGFKAPSLYQLFSDYGNPDVQPETSRAYDIGIEKGSRGGPLFIALSAFRRDSRNLIGFASCFGITDGLCATRPYGYYDNTSRARAEGFEVELAASPSATLQTGASYSYVKAVDRTPDGFTEGNDLGRRPRHALAAWIDWQTPWLLSLGADARLVGDSYENINNTTELDGFATVDLRASLPFGPVEAFGRIENLFDSGYQTAAGYATAGRSAYAGIRFRM
ncbi:TonB-dependent receptor plug domain-containing protein [Croceicoccus naphthovorans]|uniref:TonB-dependent receptor plug domain-containing protein n=1 Tax=Croceicoccus naphthovorans TaxID=1348774 RepID=UPI001FE1C0C3|nr:TonB-dependent receptor [Croceicoccus naphthovorans]